MDAEELLRADDGGVARVERKHNVAVAVGRSKCQFPLDLDSSHLLRTYGRRCHLPEARSVIWVTKGP
jgi:hypothetical protein